MPEEVSQKFNIGIKKSNYMLKVTTQKGIRHAVNPLHRRYQVDHKQMKRNCLKAQLYTYHLLAKTRYLEGHTGAWIYMTGKFTVAHLCKQCSYLGNKLYHN